MLRPIASRMALERVGRYVFLSVPGGNDLSDLYFGTDFFSESDRPQQWRVRPTASLPASPPGRFGAFPQINIGSTDDSIGIVRSLPDGARRNVFVFFGCNEMSRYELMKSDGITLQLLFRVRKARGPRCELTRARPAPTR
jgi:hypothetical protein